jgi:hypothetical protein
MVLQHQLEEEATPISEHASAQPSALDVGFQGHPPLLKQPLLLTEKMDSPAVSRLLLVPKSHLFPHILRTVVASLCEPTHGGRPDHQQTQLGAHYELALHFAARFF